MSISGSYSNQNSESYIKKLKKLAILKKDIFKKQLESKFLSFDEPSNISTNNYKLIFLIFYQIYFRHKL